MKKETTQAVREQLQKGGSTYAEGGEIYEIHSKHKDSIDSFEVDSNLQTWNTHSDAKKQADQLNKDSNSFKYKVVKKGGSTY